MGNCLMLYFKMSKHVLKTLIVFAFAIGLSYLLNVITWTDHAVQTAMEGICFLILLGVFLSLSQVRHYFINIPHPHKSLLLLFFFLMLMGQYLGKDRTTFPFVRWDMFSKEVKTDIVWFYQYYGVDRQGNRIEIHPSKVFPSLGHSRIIVTLRARVNSIIRVDGWQQMLESTEVIENVDEKKAEGKSVVRKLTALLREKILPRNYSRRTLAMKASALNSYLIALGNMYNRQNPHKPVSRIEVQRGVLNIQDIPKPHIDYSTVWQVGLEGGGSK